MVAWATVSDWLARTNAQTQRDLTVDQDAIVQEPDETRIATALDDATAELEGYRPRIPEAFWPAAETRRIHAIKVASYLLSIGKSGKEFETIRNAYTDTIAFYAALVEAAGAAAAAAGDRVAACAPPKVFTDAALKGLV